MKLYIKNIIYLKILKTEEVSQSPRYINIKAIDTESNQLVCENYSDSSKKEDSKDANNIINSVSNPKSNSNSIVNNNSKILKVKQKNEKNFKDLNKSLANLASRRITGRSSSDNDTKIFITNENMNGTQVNILTNFDIQPYYNSSQINSSTPFNPIKNNKAYQTSVQKHFEYTPMICYEGNKHNKYYNNDYKSAYRDISLSDLCYDKFQKSTNIYNKKGNHVEQKNICQTEGNTPLITKPSLNKEFSQFTKNKFNPDISQFNSVDSYFDNDKIIKTKSIYESKKILHSEENYQTNQFKNFPHYQQPTIAVKAKFGPQAPIQIQTPGQALKLQKSKSRISGYSRKTNIDNISLTTPDNDHSSIFTPAFKTNMQRQTKYTLQDRINKHTTKKIDKHNGNSVSCQTQPEHSDMISNSDYYAPDKLNLENINDGVEYTRGGLGINSSKKINKGDFIKYKTAPEETGLSMTSIKKAKKIKKVQHLDYKNTLNFLIQDILKVKMTHYFVYHIINSID